jgi:hypothetical protein
MPVSKSDFDPAVSEGGCRADHTAVEVTARRLAGGDVRRPIAGTVRGYDVGSCATCGTLIYVEQPRRAFCRLLPP